MADNPNTPAVIQPLSVGNVVDVAIRLYRTNAKSFLGIAALGTLWILLPMVVLIPIVLILVQDGAKTGVLWLMIPAWLVLLFYGFAKYLTNSALISRLSFGELINQPETVVEARRYTSSRMWSFLLAALLVGLIVGGITIAFYLVAAIVIGIVVAGLGLAFGGLGSGEPNIAVIIVGVLLSLALIVLVLTALCWFLARFAIVEVPLAIENGVGASESVGRSWALTKGAAMRILLILVVAFLITIPVQFVVQVVVAIMQGILAVFVSTSSPTYLSIVTLAAYILGLAGSIVVIPFWQAIKAAIYYDLRSRREGLGLQLRDRTS